MSYFLIEETMPLSTQTTNATGNPGSIQGQSFTIPTDTGLSSASYNLKILTSAIGGVSGSQLVNGIQATRLKLREFVNNDETSSSTNCFSGTLLATSGYGSVTGTGAGLYYPESTFIFDTPVELTVGNKYVIEIDLGGGVAVYVKITGTYPDGQAYDTNGINLSFVRDSPFRIEGHIPAPPALFSTFIPGQISGGTGDRVGQTFTVPNNMIGPVYLNSIVSHGIGGVLGTQLEGGINNSRLKLREWVNNNEGTETPSPFSGQLLATTELGIIAPWSNNQTYYPDSKFDFSGSPIQVTPGVKYIVEIEESSDVGVYVNDNNPYLFGEALDYGPGAINLSNINNKDHPLSFYGSNSGPYTPSNNADFEAALTYYFAIIKPALPGGTNVSHNSVMNISYWNTINVTNMSNAFSPSERASFNEDISRWNTENVTNMESMFQGTLFFDQNISQKYVYDVPPSIYKAWDTSKVENMSYMFFDAHKFNNNDVDLQFNTDSLVNDGLKGIFKDAVMFNQKIDRTTLSDGTIIWNVSNVKNFSEAFSGAINFDKSLTLWQPDSAEDMSKMFKGAKKYSHDILWFSQGSATVSNIQTLESMFEDTEDFLSFAREWYIPETCNINNIFLHAESMNNCFSLHEEETGYDTLSGTPDNGSADNPRFFNYDVNQPIYAPTYTFNGNPDDNIVVTILPGAYSIPNDGRNYIRLPYNVPIAIQSGGGSGPFAYGPYLYYPVTVQPSSTLGGAIDLVFNNTNEETTVQIDARIALTNPITNSGLVSVEALPLAIPLNYTYPDPDPDPDPDPEPDPEPNRPVVPLKPNRRYACTKPRCKTFMENPTKQANFFSGNTNQPNFMAVDAFKYSNLVNFASRRNAGRTVILSHNLNAFGVREGAHGGSRSKLRNKF